MSIYQEKSGRYRVELQKAGSRYRARAESRKEAQELEKLAKAYHTLHGVWPAQEGTDKAPQRTLLDLAKAANGILWAGSSSELQNWARIQKIIGILGPIDINELTTSTLDVLQASLAREVKGSTINRYLSHLHTLLDWGSTRGYARSNPEKLEFPWQDEDEGRIRWLTYAEEEQLLGLLPERSAILVEASIDGGFRRGELLSLEPSQFNGHKVHLWLTKTNSPRTVPMDERICKRLQDLVEAGGLPTAEELRQDWDKAREAMGMTKDPNFVFHSCRHTCATRLVEAGVNLRVIQAFMGHARIETTIRYAHVHDEMLEAASDAKRAHRKAA